MSYEGVSIELGRELQINDGTRSAAQDGPPLTTDFIHACQTHAAQKEAQTDS